MPESTELAPVDCGQGSRLMTTLRYFALSRKTDIVKIYAIHIAVVFHYFPMLLNTKLLNKTGTDIDHKNRSLPLPAQVSLLSCRPTESTGKLCLGISWPITTERAHRRVHHLPCLPFPLGSPGSLSSQLPLLLTLPSHSVIQSCYYPVGHSLGFLNL